MAREKSLKKWNYVKFLGSLCLEWPQPIVFRFVPYFRAQEMFSEKKIAFVSPCMWKDPYEKRYLNVNVNNKRNKLPHVACLCFKKTINDNSAAFWDNITEDSAVRLTFDLKKLLDVLDKYAKNSDSRIYVSGVNYLGINEIKNAHRNLKFMKKDLEESYIRLMSLKRRAYKYEDEIRVFIVWNRDNKNEFFKKFKCDKYLKIDFENHRIVKKILLDSNLSIAKTALDFGLCEKCAKKDFKKIEENFLKKYLPKGLKINTTSFDICSNNLQNIIHPINRR